MTTKQTKSLNVWPEDWKTISLMAVKQGKSRAEIVAEMIKALKSKP